MRKAFTTIEMIIMITLLAILMVMIVPNFITYLDNSTKSEYASAKSIIEVAAQKYIDDNGGFENLTDNYIYIDNDSTTEDLKDLKYIDERTLDSLKKYAESGQAGTGVTGTTYSKKVCIDVNNKTITYSIENDVCP